MLTDPAQLGAKNIVLTDAMKAEFLQRVYRPYLQSVIDHINGRLESTDLVSSMSVFDSRHFPDIEKNWLTMGTEKIQTLISFYCSVQEVHFDGNKGTSQPDIDPEYAKSEWKLFCRVIFVQHKQSSLQQVLSTLLSGADIAAAFPNLARLAAISILLPVCHSSYCAANLQQHEADKNKAS